MEAHPTDKQGLDDTYPPRKFRQGLFRHFLQRTWDTIIPPTAYDAGYWDKVASQAHPEAIVDSPAQSPSEPDNRPELLLRFDRNTAELTVHPNSDTQEVLHSTNLGPGGDRTFNRFTQMYFARDNDPAASYLVRDLAEQSGLRPAEIRDAANVMHEQLPDDVFSLTKGGAFRLQFGNLALASTYTHPRSAVTLDSSIESETPSKERPNEPEKEILQNSIMRFSA